MKKSILPLAVAAAMIAPTAAMADATLYGNIKLSLEYQDVDDAASYNPPNRGGFKGWDVVSRASRLGVKGSEDLGNGLKAIYQIEFDIPMADTDTAIADNDRGRVRMRNSFVGLAGGWGTLLMGRHDTPHKISTGPLDLFADTLADYNLTIGFQDVRADNTVAYISPSFAGFQLAAATIPAGGSTAEGVYNVDADSISSAWSVAGIYKNGPFYGGLAYENLGSDHWPSQDFLIIDDMGDVLLRSRAQDDTKWRIGLGLLDWNGFTLTGIYEDRSNVGGEDGRNNKLWQVQAGYAFGNNMIKGMYGQADLDATLFFDEIEDEFNLDFDSDIRSWAVGFDHNFSKRTKAYVLYTQVDDDRDSLFGNDWSGFSLGMMHKF
jgi:predicted porin